MLENPKVFIVYSHQGQSYESKVLDFANKLRAEGIDAIVDLYEESPSEGWPRWMEKKINESQYVLILNSESYYNKYYSSMEGKGISWEINIIYQYIYDSYSTNEKFIPIYFDAKEESYILKPLKSFTYYNVGTEEGYERLYYRLRGIKRNVKPPLGKLRPLPSKQQKTMFFSSPINLEKWDKAKWRGAVYLFFHDHIPVLGLLFEENDEAKLIFTEWKNRNELVPADSFIRVDFIEPPFPKECWIYTESLRNYGEGYFIHLGPNIETLKNKAKKVGISNEESIFATISRYQWMDEKNNSANRELFKETIKKTKKYMLMPISIKDKNKPLSFDNMYLNFEYGIVMNSVKFIKGTEIPKNDYRNIVLKKP